MRRTIARSIVIEGSGLFTGAKARVELSGAPVGTGLCFQPPGARVHVELVPKDGSEAPARGLTARCTALARDGWRVLTVEHLLSACAGLGVTDLHIAITGPEVPILDGSALAFADALQTAEIVTLDGPAPALRPREAVEVRDGGGSWIRATPAPGFTAEYGLDYGPGAPLRAHTARWEGDALSYMREIAPARTFCLEHEALALRGLGLFQGLTTRDMLVIGPDGAPIDNSFRFPDEPARHKLLDLIGDLALLGVPLAAHVQAHRSGHALTHTLCRRLLEQAGA